MYRIGVDEITYRRGHSYITLVVDHDTGDVVWSAEGNSKQTLCASMTSSAGSEAIGSRLCRWISARRTRRATEQACPDARLAFDPFHVIALANKALDQVYKDTARELGLSGAEWRRVRTVLRSAFEKLSDAQHVVIAKLRRLRHRIFRAWELKEALRDVYRIVDPQDAAAYLRRWITRAKRSRLRPMVVFAGTVERNFDGILAAVELGLSNSVVEGVNGRVRLIQRLGWGYNSAAPLIAMVHLCCGGVQVTLPTET